MRSSPQRGLQNTALFHMTSSVGTKVVPAPRHCWARGSGRGGDGGRLPCHGRLLELLGMTRAVKCTPLQSLFFLPCPVCVKLKVAWFSASALPVFSTLKKVPFNLSFLQTECVKHDSSHWTLTVSLKS